MTIDGPPGSPEEAPGPGRLGAARLFCDVCGEETPHRIFRVRSGGRPSTVIAGTARCRVCRTTHSFETRGPTLAPVALIVSDGPRSTRGTLQLPPDLSVEVGGTLSTPDGEVRVRKLDGADGRTRPRGRVAEIATVWATRGTGTAVKVSVVDGATTEPTRVVVEPTVRFEVGGTVSVGRQRLTIVGLRARGHTWRQPGDAFAAEEIQRIYGRRTAMPPAGRRDWRSVRSTPSSRDSSTSQRERSRSSPGVIRKRTVPRARTDDGGAAVHRSAPS